MKTSLLLLLTLFSVEIALAQSSVTLNPNKDNTLYESVSGDVSNGAGEYLFFGRTNGGDLRRALIAFDVTTVLQPGDVIVDAFLRFQVSKVPNSTSWATNVHRVSQDWGEGTSDASGEEGTGTSATTGDATWTQAFFGGTNPIPWNNAGGDFNSTASATINVSALGTYNVNSPQLTADVQDFLDNPSNNFGWIIIGDEATNASARRINSRENSTSPVSLEIRFNRAVGLNDNLNDLNAVVIVPNPVKNSFELKNADELEAIEIFDLSGKSRMILNPNNTDFNISTLDRGIYLLKLQLGEKSVTQKLVKQ